MAAMLRDVRSGLLLAAGPDGQLVRSARGDDRAMWNDQGGESGCFASATVPGLAVRGVPAATSPNTLEERRWRMDGTEFDEVFAPTRLPSEHLAELRATGITVLPGFSAAVTDALRKAVHDVNFVDAIDLDDPKASTVQLHLGARGSGRQVHVLRDGKVEGGPAPAPMRVAAAEVQPVPHGGACVVLTLEDGGRRRFGLPDQASAEDVAERVRGGGSSARSYLYEERGHLFGRVHTHPVVLWLLESYFGTPVCASHTPGAKVIMPQDGSLGPGQGWHSDTPVSTRTELCSNDLLPAMSLLPDLSSWRPNIVLCGGMADLPCMCLTVLGRTVVRQRLAWSATRKDMAGR